MSERYHVSGRQLASARVLIGMSQTSLADISNVSIATLRRMEGSQGAASGLTNNLLAVKSALESAGVEFIEENGGGPGVRLRI